MLAYRVFGEGSRAPFDPLLVEAEGYFTLKIHKFQIL